MTSPVEKSRALAVIADEVKTCVKCDLSRTRKTAVPGTGSSTAKMVIVGEAPGACEDEVGEPFVGRSGKLLDEIIATQEGLRRSDIFVTNTVRCRPANNRRPLPNEIFQCNAYLRRQLDVLSPDVVLALGSTAAEVLTGETIALGKLRGRNLAESRPAIVVTYHPSYGLRMGSSIVQLMKSDLEVAFRFVTEV